MRNVRLRTLSLTAELVHGLHDHVEHLEGVPGTGARWRTCASWPTCRGNGVGSARRTKEVQGGARRLGLAMPVPGPPSQVAAEPPLAPRRERPPGLTPGPTGVGESDRGQAQEAVWVAIALCQREMVSRKT